MKNYRSIDEYIAGYPLPVQERLVRIRSIVHQAAPDAMEKISYGMPAFNLHGMLLYFAAHSNHIGFYPFKTAIVAFKEELTGYKTSKGTVQFPHNIPLPEKLIARIVEFRVIENRFKAETKARLKHKPLENQ